VPTLSATPAYPVPGKPAKLRLTLAESGTNLVKLWLTDAPPASKHKRDLVARQQSRSLVYAGPGGANAELAFEPDVGGAYVFAAQEYALGASNYGGGYQDSPDGHQSETAIGSEVTRTLYVGQRMTQTLGNGTHSAQLVVYVFNDTIRATTVPVHGEATPDIINPSSAAARIASLASSVQTQLSALTADTVATVAGGLSSAVDDLIVRFNAHRTQASVHATSDTDNTIDVSFRVPTGPAGIVESCNELLRKLDLHMRNAKADATATGSQAYHNKGGNKRADLANKLIATSASSADLASAFALVGDCWRAYEAHRADGTTYHNSADSTNIATALGGALLLLHQHYMNSLRQGNPTAPATEQSGAVQLAQTAGFRED
jgi:hypothetical protein